MPKIIPFKALRPIAELAEKVCANNDAGSPEAIREVMRQNPLSYLHVVKPHLLNNEKPAQSLHKGRVFLDKLIADGVMQRDIEPCYYIYRNIKGSKAYTGIIAAAAVDDYMDNKICKHENTLSEKQAKLLEHIKHFGNIGMPVLITYPDTKVIGSIIRDITQHKPEYNFISSDQVKHNLWLVKDAEHIGQIGNAFASMDKIYIADGHHRSAGAATYTQYKRAENPAYDGSETFNFFPVCLLPYSGVHIFEYHRMVKDKAVNDPEFIQQIKEYFDVNFVGNLPFQPLYKAEFGLYIKGQAYQLSLKEEYKPTGILEILDVSIVEEFILKKILKIFDSKTDERLSFLDGSKGLGTLQARVDDGFADLAITLFPASVEEVIAVADHNLIMPPKATWIEPKIPTGMVVYEM